MTKVQLCYLLSVMVLQRVCTGKFRDIMQEDTLQMRGTVNGQNSKLEYIPTLKCVLGPKYQYLCCSWTILGVPVAIESFQVVHPSSRYRTTLIVHH